MDSNPYRRALKAKEQAYRAVFRGQDKTLHESAKTVLADLRIFCNGTKSPFNKDPYETARNVGKQEVFQRIMNFLEIDYSEFYRFVEDDD